MQISILGVPMDLGAGRRGVDMGPSAIRCAGLAETLIALGHEVVDLGNVGVPVVEMLDHAVTDEQGEKHGMRYLEAIRAACEEIVRRLRNLGPEVFPITIGGDHSLSMGTVPGVARSERVGLIWVDAHTDFNVPETSPSGNIHGMPVAHLVGLGDPRLAHIGGDVGVVRPEDIVMIGVRSVDRGERQLLREQGAVIYSMKEIDLLGISRIAEETVHRLAGLERVHLSFDADVLDPAVAPGVGTPVAGGLTYREAHLLMELFSDARFVTSLDLVEVNPALDHENLTSQVVVEMAASLLGKTIW